MEVNMVQRVAMGTLIAVVACVGLLVILSVLVISLIKTKSFA